MCVCVCVCARACKYVRLPQTPVLRASQCQRSRAQLPLTLPRPPSPPTPPPPQVWARYPMLDTLSKTSSNFLKKLPHVNYGLGMWQKPTNVEGITEALSPLNGTALGNHTQLVNAVHQVPNAVLTGLNLNLAATTAMFTKNGEEVHNALAGGNLTDAVHAAVKAAIPSAAGAIDA